MVLLVMVMGWGGVGGGLVRAEAEPVRAGSEPARVRKTNADFPTHLRSEPDGLQSIGRIPVSTDIEIRDRRVLQVGKFKENWYLADFDGKTGWVRGDDLEGESAEKTFSITYQAPDLPGSSSPGGISF